MTSWFSVARIKDKTAHSSCNHLLFSTAAMLPLAQQSYCHQDLHARNSERSSTCFHGLPLDATVGRAGDGAVLAEADLHVPHNLSPA